MMVSFPAEFREQALNDSHGPIQYLRLHSFLIFFRQKEYSPLYMRYIHQM